VSLLKFAYSYRWPARLLILVLALGAALAGLCSPFFQKAFVDRLMGSPLFPHSHAKLVAVMESYHPLIFVLGAFVCTILSQALNLFGNYVGAREGIYLQRIWAEKLYAKTLLLRPDRMQSSTVGEIVSIYATDVPGSTILVEQAIPMAAGIFFPLILAPIAIHWLIDIPLTNTLIVMGAMILVSFLMATRQSRFFYLFKFLAAQRTGLVNEWIQNLRLLRILGWVESFETRIFAKREEETENRVSMVTNGQLMNSFSSSITYVINLTGLSALVFWSHHQVTAGELFALLWIFGAFLTRAFRQFPWLCTQAMDALSSLRRVESFLNRPTGTNESDNFFAPGSEVAVSSRPLALRVKNLNLEMGNRKLLDSIDLEVREGELLAVIGEVGSGKSLLVLSLMGETGASFDELTVGSHASARNLLVMDLNERRRHFAFVPQEGFVMSATIRENVAFEYGSGANRELDSRVRRALELAQLNLAVDALGDGLNTEIGERGVNLSGGQRQRISLARAQYFDRPIVLLDDSLSAVDVDTEEHLVSELICGDWKDKTRILVTHRLSVLDRVDRVIFIEDGRIVENGKFEALAQTSERVQRFIKTAKGGDSGISGINGVSESESQSQSQSQSQSPIPIEDLP